MKTGDRIRVIKTEASAEEWQGIGEIKVTFQVGDEFIITSVGRGISFSDKHIKAGSFYPRSMFEVIKEFPIF